MPGPAVAVGHQDVAEAAARQRATVVDERVADDALAHAHGSHGVEGERSRGGAWGQHTVPPAARGQALAIVSRSSGPAIASTPTGRCGPVLFERAHVRTTTVRARSSASRAGVDISSGVGRSKELPFVAARYSVLGLLQLLDDRLAVGREPPRRVRADQREGAEAEPVRRRPAPTQ